MAQNSVVAIAGGTCSGKTTLAIALQEAIGVNRSCSLSMDSYYIYPNPSMVNSDDYNFDHPNALDLGLFNDDLTSLIAGKSIYSPIYDRRLHKSVGSKLCAPAQITIVEGLFVLWDENVRNHTTLGIFIDTDADIRLGRRMIRDSIEYGLDLQQVITNYVDVARPMHNQFIEPTKQHADLVLRWPTSIQEEVSLVLEILGY